MNRSKSYMTSIIGVSLVTALVFIVTGTSFAASREHVMLNSKLYGNIPNVTIRGIQAGKAPWVVEGHVTLTGNHILATGKWLIVPKTGFMSNGVPVPKVIGGTTIGVTSVVADITFANAKSVVTAPVKLNAKGDFTINATVSLPQGAAQPVVLIGPGGKGGLKAWFASSNFLTDYGVASIGSTGSTSSSW